MIGRKLARRTSDFFSKVKSYAGSAYYHGKSLAQAIDQGADIVRRVHGALEPALKDSQYGRAASQNIKSGLGNFEHLKSGVLKRHREKAPDRQLFLQAGGQKARQRKNGTSSKRLMCFIQEAVVMIRPKWSR